MQVTLKVVGGKHNGREIKVVGSKFTIGRAEGADLRPTSDLISRNHCGIFIEKGEVVVEDFGSRNGTFINGERISGRQTARPGDCLRVGRLQFELVLDPSRSVKKEKVASVVEAAARTAQSAKPAGIEDSISGWLESAEDDSETNKKTIRFEMGETQTIEKPSEEISKEQSSAEIQVETDSKVKKKKKKPGKLPAIPNQGSSSTDSKAAADEALKKFFNRR